MIARPRTSTGMEHISTILHRVLKELKKTYENRSSGRPGALNGEPIPPRPAISGIGGEGEQGHSLGSIISNSSETEKAF
jgi:hypothetical protein